MSLDKRGIENNCLHSDRKSKQRRIEEENCNSQNSMSDEYEYDFVVIGGGDLRLLYPDVFTHL